MEFRKASTPLEGVGICLYIASRTAVYANESLAPVTERLLSSVLRDQYIIGYVNGRAVAFATWAFLGALEAQTFVNRVRPLVNEEYKSGEQTWCIDFCCELSDPAPLVDYLKETLKATQANPIMGTKVTATSGSRYAVHKYYANNKAADIKELS